MCDKDKIDYERYRNQLVETNPSFKCNLLKYMYNTQKILFQTRNFKKCERILTTTRHCTVVFILSSFSFGIYRLAAINKLKK